jgi:hypothetical protein
MGHPWPLPTSEPGPQGARVREPGSAAPAFTTQPPRGGWATRPSLAPQQWRDGRGGSLPQRTTGAPASAQAAAAHAPFRLYSAGRHDASPMCATDSAHRGARSPLPRRAPPLPCARRSQKGGHPWPPGPTQGGELCRPVHLRHQDQRAGARKVGNHSKALHHPALKGANARSTARRRYGVPGPPWLWQDAGRSVCGPVHWPLWPAPLPPLVGGARRGPGGGRQPDAQGARGQRGGHEPAGTRHGLPNGLCRDAVGRPGGARDRRSASTARIPAAPGRPRPRPRVRRAASVVTTRLRRAVRGPSPASHRRRHLGDRGRQPRRGADGGQPRV